MALKRKTGPAVQVVTVAEAKAQCAIDHSDHDDLIERMIAAVTANFDGHDGVLGRCLISQVWELYLDAFPCEVLQVPLGNLITVDSIEYVHPTTGVMTVWASGNYAVDAVPVKGWVKPVDAWPAAMETMNAVKVTFTAGYGAAASDVPQDIRHALLWMVGHLYANREAVIIGETAMKLPMAVEYLLANHRIYT